MSEQRRASPIHPPFVTDASNPMAQVHQPLLFSTPSFLGRPEHRSVPDFGSSLPPIRNERPQHMTARYNGPSLPPVHLPPMDPSRVDNPSHHTAKIGITSLLSAQPSPSTPAHPGIPSQPGQQAFTRHSAGRIDSGPREERPTPSTHVLPTIGGPPQASTYPFAPQRPLAHEQFTFTAARPPYPPAKSEPDYDPYSPVATSRSSAASVYESASEPSPRTSVAPSYPAPPRPRISQPPPLRYDLTIRQQPVAARACGFGERDRRVIDPPPILELKITRKETGAPDADHNAMLALHCTLLSPDGRDDETEVPPAHPEMPSTRRLMGTLVASPYQAKDEHGIAGMFFVFPDLSCRSPGKYRLRFKLLRVDPTNMLPGAIHGSVANIVTDTFDVYTAKDFPGMRASSALLKSLRRQGLNVGVKKGSEARKGKGKAKKDSSSEDEDEDSSEDEDDEDVRRGSAGTSGSVEMGGLSPRTRAKKKSKRRRRDS